MALPKRLEQKPDGTKTVQANERRRAVEAYNSTPETAQARRAELYQRVKQIDRSAHPKDTFLGR